MLQVDRPQELDEKRKQNENVQIYQYSFVLCAADSDAAVAVTDYLLL